MSPAGPLNLEATALTMRLPAKPPHCPYYSVHVYQQQEIAIIMNLLLAPFLEVLHF